MDTRTDQLIRKLLQEFRERIMRPELGRERKNENYRKLEELQ